MIAMLKNSFVIYLIILLLSCSNNTKVNDVSGNEKEMQNMAKRYKANTNWDSTFLYTLHYQEMFIDENELMLFRGRIYDIKKEDSTYVLKILNEKENARQNFLAIISITTDQLNQIYADNKSTKGGFIIKVSEVTSSNPRITIDESNDGEGSYTYSHLNDDADQMITIFKGKLIDLSLENIKD